MNNQFKSLCKDLLTEEENLYSTNVQTTIYLNIPPEQRDSFDYDTFQDVLVKFSIDMEARSWGIKTLTVSLVSVSPLSIELINAETKQVDRTIEIQIDASKLKTETLQPKGHIGLGDMDLFVDTNGVVDYNRSSIEVFAI